MKHKISQKVYYSKWYKFISIALFISLLLCLFFKCCKSTDTVSYQENNPSTIEYIETNPNEIADNQRNSSRVYPNRPLPINPEKVIIIEDDPLKRSAVKDLINVYLMDTVQIQYFVQNIQTKLPTFNLQPTYYAEEYKRVQFSVNESDKSIAMNEIMKDSLNVKYVTHEWVYKQSNNALNDPDFQNIDNFWFYEDIGLLEVWKITKGSEDIKIAVLDDGFDLNHKELKNRYINPWNIMNYSDNVYAHPEHLFHGTHVAGTIVGESENDFGISGVAPGCQFIPVQISDESGYISMTSILDGIFYALKNNADIINLSLGYMLSEEVQHLDQIQQETIRDNYLLDEEKLWDEVFEIAEKSNTIIVQAAGNQNILAEIDPMKRSFNSIVVGSLDKNSNQSVFSNYGERVTVYAPGENIYSSLPNNQMGNLDGTSMSTPIVAGCVALIKSFKPQISAKEIRDLINSTTEERNGKINIDEIFKKLS